MALIRPVARGIYLADMEDVLNCTRIDHDTVKCGGKEYHLEELLGATDGRFWAYLLTYMVLVLFAGRLLRS